MVPFEDFKKLDIRIAKILSAEKIEGTDKLLRLEIEFDSQWRQIVAGIGTVYDHKELNGKQIVVITNLKPRTIKGVESQAMLLAAESPDGPVLLVPDKEVIPGAKVS